MKAFENRTELEKDKHAKNYSFDAGSTITDTYKDETIEGTKLEYEMSIRLQIGGAHGWKAAGTGMMWEFKNDLGVGKKRIEEHSTNEVTTFSYTLKDNDVKDAISVDVYNVDAFGPIFRTRAGQTSNPYEGEVKTKYYEPGTTIMEATMQVDVPKISVENPMVNNIPAGSAANYTLGLANQSQIGEELYYLLMVPEETNPHGAQITVDGMSLSSGNRKIKVPYGETLYKSMQLKQSDISILDYDRIAIVLASVNQYDPTDNMDVIADTVWVSAHFVPSSSSVNLAMSNNLMNTQTGSKLTLTFSDFDRNYKNLKAFRLQYRKQGSTDWTLLHQYVLNKADSTANSSMLPEIPVPCGLCSHVWRQRGLSLQRRTAIDEGHAATAAHRPAVAFERHPDQQLRSDADLQRGHPERHAHETTELPRGGCDERKPRGPRRGAQRKRQCCYG